MLLHLLFIFTNRKISKKIHSAAYLRMDLFKTDGFSRMNSADQVRRSHQHQHRNKQRAYIQQNHPAQVKFNGTALT